MDKDQRKKNVDSERISEIMDDLVRIRHAMQPSIQIRNHVEYASASYGMV